MTKDETIWNERLKLGALWLNNLAIALVTAGVFGPIASSVYGIPMSAGPMTLFLSTMGCFCGSGAIHLIAQSILGGLR